MVDLPATPSEILALSPNAADQLLDELERGVRVHAPFVPVRPGAAEEAIVFGDTHGDWRSTQAVVDGFSAPGRERMLIGLGDYIDRSPDDCGEGSVANALYLLSLAARYPDRVLLLQGNHETCRRIPAVPHHLPEEVDALWGPEIDRYTRLLALLERGPIAAATPNGAYLAHAGFPRRLASPWTASFDRLDDEGLCEVVWAECDVSRNRRGAAPPWGRAELDRFLRASALSVVLRGHDPDLCGRPLYGGRCLTLHTTRIYERFGGVICATLPFGFPLTSVSQIEVRHLSSEGRSYPPS
jgi:hypothetical protein